MAYLLVGIGGAMGAIARFLLIDWGARRFRRFPAGTLIVNLTGSFALGLLLVQAGERVAVPEEIRFLLASGFLGGYTTFSTFSWETAQLLLRGRLVLALINVVLSAGGGLLAALAGIVAGRLL